MKHNDCAGAELLRKYREYSIESFLLERKLIDEIEDFFYTKIDNHMAAFDVFINDSGKWIVVSDYNNYGNLTEAIVEEFCKKYNVTLDHITTEHTTDYEGNKSLGNVTYLFEIVK